MFGSIGPMELVVILVIALIVFGPRKLPELGKSLGKSLGEFKRASNDLRNTLEEEIHVEEQAERQEVQPTKPAPEKPSEPETPVTQNQPAADSTTNSHAAESAATSPDGAQPDSTGSV